MAERTNMGNADDGAVEDEILERASARKTGMNGCTGCGEDGLWVAERLVSWRQTGTQPLSAWKGS
jgi:hypothetical protein